MHSVLQPVQCQTDWCFVKFGLRSTADTCICPIFKNDDVLCGGCKWSAILKADVKPLLCYRYVDWFSFIHMECGSPTLQVFEAIGKNDSQHVAVCHNSQRWSLSQLMDQQGRYCMHLRSFGEEVTTIVINCIDCIWLMSHFMPVCFLLYSLFVEASESCKNKTHNPGSFFSMRASTMSIHFSLLSLAGCGKYSHPCVTCSAESENHRHCFTFRTGIHSLYIFTFFMLLALQQT